jgi:hypothetical protein
VKDPVPKDKSTGAKSVPRFVTERSQRRGISVDEASP